MTRLAVTLGIVAAVSSFAWGFSEDFESYSAGATIAGVNNWIETGLGDWYQANATDSADPSFLGQRYADLGNNGLSGSSGEARLAQVFGQVTTGDLVVDFDVSFGVVGSLNACNIFLCDSSRTPGSDVSLQAAAIYIGAPGLRIHDGDWQTADNFTVANDTWYHMRIAMDLDAKTWQLSIATYDENENLTVPEAIYYLDNENTIVDTFVFRDSSTLLNDIGVIEFATSSAIMADSAGRGFHVDNINVPEPATLSVLAVAGVLAMRRRNA